MKRRLPITEWLPNYQKSFFLQDFVAGLSVGLTAIPQGLSVSKRLVASGNNSL
jgi:MFS superfamily sulfate permease-like transporter